MEEALKIYNTHYTVFEEKLRTSKSLANPREEKVSPVNNLCCLSFSLFPVPQYKSIKHLILLTKKPGEVLAIFLNFPNSGSGIKNHTFKKSTNQFRTIFLGVEWSESTRPLTE